VALSEETQWRRVRAAIELAKGTPSPRGGNAGRDGLLDALRDLQSFDDAKKEYLLIEMSRHFALAAIERPTLAECRAAMAAPPDVPRAIRGWFKWPASEKTIDDVTAFLHEVLVAAGEEPSVCLVETRRETTYVPGTPDEAPHDREDIVIEGTRRDSTRRVRVVMSAGESPTMIEVDAPTAERDETFRRFLQMFASG
jgi:hypothetical protein